MQLLNRRQVSERLSIGKTLVYNLVKAGKLAKPLEISSRRVGWLEADIEAFIASRQVSSHYRAK